MPVNVAVTGLKSVFFVSSNDLERIPVLSIKKQIGLQEGIKEQDYYFVQDGRVLSDLDSVAVPRDEANVVVNAFPRVLGGKGGFGSLIRAMGKSTQKSQNTEACRDLSGRRLRDISTEKKLSQWIKDAAEKEKETEEEKKVRRERRLAGPKHVFNDHKYMNQIQANAESIDDALKQGLVASSSSGVIAGIKRPSTAQASQKSKKIHLWTGVDDLSDASEDSDNEQQSGKNSIPDNEATCSSFLPSIRNAEINSSEVNSANESSGSSPLETRLTSNNEAEVKEKSSNGFPVVSDERATEDTLPPESCNVDEATQVNETVSGSKSPLNETTSSSVGTFEPIDLEKYGTVEELISAISADHLKAALQKLGLKCGGTPAQRGERLFATKGKSLSELDPSLFVKAKKHKK